ncbi:hypothetical protein [Lysinibacillus sphaericus]|uniref:Phage-like protein n=1 Tax=Lysinibacillus sphaericus OT4b.31 TaxID=1285586 RepID=R7Z8X3_LYSSH|nr:hypothetical protein [Lysinibacillus sphaericus]EON70479.1 phage-like protein [Lysinibacillus sphaericus OT4b.31]
MTKNNNNGVYIQSIEANKIYANNKRGDYLTRDYVGKLPYSMQLIKMLSLKGFKTFESKFNSNKLLSNAVVNVSFDYDVDNAKTIIERTKERIEEYKSYLEKLRLEDNKEKDVKKLEKEIKRKEKEIEKLGKKIDDAETYLEKVEEEKENKEWKSVKVEELREILYQDGFFIDYKKDDKTVRVEYVQFSRSSSKSRKGEVLFIEKKLHKEMTEWQRMGLKFDEEETIDLVSIRAYESLIGSAIQGLININVDNILLVDDVKSTFKEDVNLVYAEGKGKKKRLTVDKADNHSITNDIFDGESLLDVRVFKASDYADKSFVLLRNHFFKSAAFKTDIQLFLKDNCPDGVKYDEWVLHDMFGNPILAENVKMIVTPNSMKMFKMAYKMKLDDVNANREAMYAYWKDVVRDEGQMFGVCKYEKPSQAPKLQDGTITQQMSYQMINALLVNQDDMNELLAIDKKYIDELKNNPSTLIEHLKATSNDNNLNEFYVNLYEINPEFIYTKMFKDYRSQVVNRYKKRVAKGKVRVQGDNLTMLSNPIELLKQAINKLDLDDLTLSGNQVYTTQFDFWQDVALHRNPHTNMSNVLAVHNTYNANIKKYIKVSKEIIVVNSVNHSIMSRLSGADFDSDFVHATNNSTVVRLAKKANEDYLVCETSVGESEDEAIVYKLTDIDMAKADNKIAESKTVIGECVNSGQLAMSLFHHLQSIGENEKAEQVLQLTNLVAALSTLAIDVAKKTFEIDVKKAVRSVVLAVNKYINKDAGIFKFEEVPKEKKKFKPSFFENIDRKKRKEVMYVQFNTPMDMLQDILNNDDNAKPTKTNELIDLLNNSLDKDKANRNQKKKLIEIGEELEDAIAKIYVDTKDKEKQFTLINDVARKFETRIGKLKIKPETIYSFICDIHDPNAKVKIDKKYNRLLKFIIKTHKEIFVNIFSENFNGSINENSEKAS